MFTINDGIFILRLLLGLLFVGHGTQKLFGWFGGNGLKGTAGWLESLNFRPAKFWTWVVGLGEALGGLGLVFGFLTPIAAALIIGSMVMAILKVHWAHGIWNTKGGLEYPLVILFVTAFIGLFGPGAVALDTLLRLHYPMPLTFGVAVIIALLGVVVGLLTTIKRGSTEHQYT